MFTSAGWRARGEEKDIGRAFLNAAETREANKIYGSPVAALEGVLFDGVTIMSGGFGLTGNPESLIPVIREAGTRDLTVISKKCGADGFGLWMLLDTRQITKMISSYVGDNKLFEQLYLSGDLALELNPQGTLAEGIRAGGARIPAFMSIGSSKRR